jgi:hypothetical protein
MIISSQLQSYGAAGMGGVGGVATLGGTAPLNSEFVVNLLGHPFGLFGMKGFFMGSDVYDVGVFTLFLFQMVFMDTAGTIPTGAMAERWKWSAFLAFGFFMSMIVYPIFGNWAWGGGWLSQLGKNDQAEAQLAQTVREVRTMFANNGTLKAQIASREADLARAQSDLVRAQDDVTRRAPLVTTGAVGNQDRVLTRADLYDAIDAGTRLSMRRSDVNASAKIASGLAEALGGVQGPGKDLSTNEAS